MSNHWGMKRRTFLLSLGSLAGATTSGLLGGLLAQCSSIGSSANSGTTPNSNANLMGINIGAPLDWEEDRIFTNVMKTARDWEKPGGGTPALDAEGYPLEDAGCMVWAGIGNMHGTYKLSFTGTADVTAELASASLQNKTYDSNTNTTTADLVYNNTDPAQLHLKFSNTKGGVKNIKLMRPKLPGSKESYSPSSHFTDAVKQAIAKFSVVRFMDYTSTNSSQQVNWSDRVQPGYCSFNRTAPNYGWQGKGGAWEYVIALCNETGKDAWICVPCLANDDYIKNLALLLKNGGNGFPGLNANLKLYIEYSNELWNTAGAFSQSRQNHDAAVAEVKAGRSPLNYDGEKNDWYWAWRRIGKRTIEISNIFRSVFGDAAMMSRIRPVLQWQQGNGQATASNILAFLENYYNNQAGNLVPDPHPVNYYIWGAGGSGYYSPENDSAALTLDNFWSSSTMKLENWASAQTQDANWVSCFDLRKVAYEGGPSLDKCNCAADAVKAKAVNDPRLKQALIDHHNAWSSWSGDLLMYFHLAGQPGDFQWSFTQNIYDLNTPKYQAIDALNRTEKSPLAYGSLLPASIDGNAWGVTNRGYGEPQSGAIKVEPGLWFSYPVRTNADRTYQVSVDYIAAHAGSMRLYLGNQVLGDVPIANGNGETRSTPPFKISLQSNKLYSIRVRSRDAVFDCVKVNITAA